MSYNTNHNNNFVEIYAIGNELLVGQVLDTNTHWLIRNITAAGAQVRRTAMIRDDYDDIGEQLLAAIARQPKLIVTTGGTGPSARDVTPEATNAVCDRLLPGFGEQMRAVSMRTVSTAILSRQIAGTRGATLIINLPGKPAAIEDCLAAVFAAIPYCVELIGGPKIASTSAAPAAVRPKGV